MTPTRPLAYPPAHTVDVVDDYHGTSVPDPYRWLEDPAAPDTQAWVEAENRLTESFLAVCPAREPLRARLTQLWDYARYGVPRRRGDLLFHWKNDGLQNQPVLYVRPADLVRDPSADGDVLLDPNTLSPDGTAAVTGESYTHDGRLLAYGVSRSGSDWQELHVRDVHTRADLPDTVRWCKFASVAWTRDQRGFFYNRYPEPGTVSPEDQANFQCVCWHQLGTSQDADSTVFQHEDKELRFSPHLSDDGATLLLTGYRGTEPKNRLYFRPAGSDQPFTRLIDMPDARYEPIDVVDGVLYVHTDLYAPHGRIIAIDLRDPGTASDRARWREVVPETHDVIDHVALVGDRLVTVYLQDVHHVVRLYGLDGASQGAIELPGIGAISGLSGRREDSGCFFGFTSFLSPQTIFHHDLTTGRTSVFRQPSLAFDADAYETTQVFYPSRDGTRIPMFLTHRKGIALDGSHPTILYGYGGFNISLTPSFSVARLVWLEQGGIFAVANLRGGAEYGAAWHEAGILDRKQNVFDDFIAAAEWLIDRGYTSTPRLAIQGGSNGGLLVGACMTQRPDLFGAVLCQVPVADMLRYHRFTIGRFWVSDYGNAEADPDHFRFLYAYSPLHNVRLGTAYPPTLITSADTDDRVVPAHAKKLAATLQAAQGGDAPVLIRIETKAGHGAGKPTAKLIKEQADVYAFACQVLGVPAGASSATGAAGVTGATPAAGSPTP